MDIHRDLATAIENYKAATGKTYAECAAEFDISLSSIKEYAAGRGNPSFETIARMASKMGLDVALFICSSYSKDKISILIKLLDMIGLLKDLAPENRVRFAKLVDQMVDLLNGGDGDA